MSIQALVDACVRCVRCGKQGTCDCWHKCECGLCVARGEPCTSLGHSPEADEFLKNGYFVFNEDWTRVRKTYGSRWAIREGMESGNIFATRKEANEFIRQIERDAGKAIREYGKGSAK